MKRAAVLFLLVTLPALADIGTAELFNTGLNSSGGPLPSGVGDPHWTLTGSAGTGISGSPQAIVIESGWPLGGPWASNTSNSQWVGPQANPGLGNPPQPGSETCAPNCNYIYSTSFWIGSITGGPTLTLNWAADNALLDVIVVNSTHPNGVDNPTSLSNTDLTAASSSYLSLQQFTISSGLAVGENTLEFVVNNFGYPGPDPPQGWPGANPTGLQVQFTADAGLTVPEPTAFVLLPLMVGALVGFHKRKSA